VVPHGRLRTIEVKALARSLARCEAERASPTGTTRGAR
jgi:hypothetical protein